MSDEGLQMAELGWGIGFIGLVEGEGGQEGGEIVCRHISILFLAKPVW